MVIRIERPELAYGAVRSHLATTTSVDPRLTHWEFYEACLEDGLDDGRQPGFELLTDAYERATFAGIAVSEEKAQDAVGVADGIVAERTGSDVE